MVQQPHYVFHVAQALGRDHAEHVTDAPVSQLHRLSLKQAATVRAGLQPLPSRRTMMS
jgi:hypothetical protein